MNVSATHEYHGVTRATNTIQTIKLGKAARPFSFQGGIVSRDGMELLIHVGVDTVKMNGKGFHTLVNEGDEVKAGQELLRFDIEEIKSAGFSPVTAVLVTNSDDYGSIKVQETSGSRMEELISVQ